MTRLEFLNRMVSQHGFTRDIVLELLKDAGRASAEANVRGFLPIDNNVRIRMDGDGINAWWDVYWEKETDNRSIPLVKWEKVADALFDAAGGRQEAPDKKSYRHLIGATVALEPPPLPRSRPNRWTVDRVADDGRVVLRNNSDGTELPAPGGCCMVI